jgi:opacity protein-like surface antigen
MNKHQTLKAGILSFLMLFAITSIHSQSARVEISPFGGYLLGGSVKFYEGKFKIENGASYGGMLAVKARGGNFVELSYTRMDSKGEWRPYSGFNIDYPETTIDLAVNYLQINSLNEFPLDNEAIRPYGTIGIGATWFHPKDEGDDEWLFAMNAGLGLKYFFNDRIGIRLQARLLLPMIFNGGGFYFGIGTGGASTGVGVTSTTPIVQGDFTGGLVIALGE